MPGNNYIAFSITQGNKYREKSWPLEKFIELARSVYITNDKRAEIKLEINISTATMINGKIISTAVTNIVGLEI